MEKNLTDSVLKVCTILNKHFVEYLIAGGAAVAFHGFYRPSTGPTGLPVEKDDLDFWYNPNYKNYFKLLNALEELGQDVSKFKKEKSPNPKKSFFKLEFEKFTIDFLPELNGLSKFRSAYCKREVSNISGVEIPIITYQDLIDNKKTNARPKDLKDIEQLESRIKKLK